MKKNFALVAGYARGTVKTFEAVIGKDRFRFACQSTFDNMKAGETGFVRDEYGGFFKISRDSKSAKRVSENLAPEIAKLFE